MKSIARSTTVGALIAGMAGAVASPTWAAATSGSDNVLEEVVVTATRVESDVQKTAVAINVYSGEQLAEQDVHDISSLQNRRGNASADASSCGTSAIQAATWVMPTFGCTRVAAVSGNLL